MSTLGRLLIATLIAAPLAGCLGGDGSVESAGAGDANDTNATFDAPAGRGQIVAFEETNQTEEGQGGVDHHHDYWMGASRVTVFEKHAAMTPMNPHQAGTYEASVVFRPPLGALIFEGTETVEFTVTNPERHYCPTTARLNGEYVCTDRFGVPRAPDPTGGPSGLTLLYKHASTNEWIEVGDLAWGEALPIKVTDPRQTDMPHATASLWEFQVVSPHKQDGTLTFTAKAELVRGEGDIPKWPGHPDFYPDGLTHRTVLEATGAVACGGTSGCALASGEPEELTPDRLISYGTRTLHVWLNVTSVQAPNPALAPTNWFLFVYNATGRDNITDPFSADHPATKMEHHWALPVDDSAMDSPYSDGSRWRFQLGGSLTTPAISCYAGCAEWAATYDLKIVASSVVLPPEQYHYHCLRDGECPPRDDGDGRRT